MSHRLLLIHMNYLQNPKTSFFMNYITDHMGDVNELYDRCHVCHCSSHQHYQEFHPEKWEITNTKEVNFVDPFCLLSVMKGSKGSQIPLNLT